MIDSQETQIYNKLQERYPQANPNILRQLASIKCLLMDQDYGNKKLEELQNSLNANTTISLDDFLINEETTQEFQRREEVNDVLSRNAFLQLLKNKKQILDGGTPPDHGAHSHRLQWYIIYQAVKEKRINVIPGTLYQELSEDAFLDPRDENRTIWDDIFDFDQDSRAIIGVPDDVDENTALQKAGYSSPEFLQKCLTRNNVLPEGRLTHELKLLRLRSETFGALGVLDYPEALREAIVVKTVMQNPNASDKVQELQAELQTLPVDALESRYLELDPAYRKKLNQVKEAV